MEYIKTSGPNNESRSIALKKKRYSLAIFVVFFSFQVKHDYNAIYSVSLQEEQNGSFRFSMLCDTSVALSNLPCFSTCRARGNTQDELQNYHNAAPFSATFS